MTAEKLGLDNQVHELKVGDSFSRGDSVAFHSIRYDFKPASVDTSQRSCVDVGQGHQVTVTVPHVEGSGTQQTVYKGNKRPLQKECVLIVDHTTGEFTLEKLASNIQLKKTRSENSSKRPVTPVEHVKVKTAAASSASSSPNVKASKPPTPHHHHHQQQHHQQQPPPPQPQPPQIAEKSRLDSLVGEISDSSSSDSGSGSGSDSDSDDEPQRAPQMAPSTHSSLSTHNHHPSKAFESIAEDLQLSESGSDSD